MFSSRVITISWHVTGWLLFASLIGGFTMSINGGKNLSELLRTPPFFLFLFIYVFIFYFNGYFLFPKLYLNKKYVAYFMLVGALLVLAYFFKPFDRTLGHRSQDSNPLSRGERFRENKNQSPPPFDRNRTGNFSDQRHSLPPDDFRDDRDRKVGPPGERAGAGGPAIDIVGVVLFIMACSFSSLFPILKQWRATEKRVLQAEADKANAELSFLRAQINPHFLFNTLNNIYSLAVTKNDGGPQAIMKLSQMLRYVTDEATQDYVSLEREIQCISNYIALQQLRLTTNVTIHFSVSGQVEEQLIPPLILMTFVENVFKYGISSHDATTITITISVENRNIRFFCRNKIFIQPHEENRKGIGIENAGKRLNFLYPGMHTLVMNQQDGLFTVLLELKKEAN